MSKLDHFNQVLSNHNDNNDDNKIDSIDDVEFANIMDERDELSEFKNKFLFPKKVQEDENSGDSIYLCGNSLGLQPKTTKDRILQELDDWKTYGVEGHWNSKYPWLTADEVVLPHLSNLVGARQEEVCCMNSLTTNLHLFMLSFYRPKGNRTKILIEAKAFPSDIYATESQIEIHNLAPEEHLIKLSPKEGQDYVRTEDVLSVIEEEGDNIALVMLCGVQYYTGNFYDIPTITEAAHAKGCRVGWDLAHTVGNIPLKLHDWNVDFAVWCHYKYCNSGPGAIGGAFVHGSLSGVEEGNENANNNVDQPEKHNDLVRVKGWWGHNLKTRFDMDYPFDAVPGAFGWRLSNPPIFQIAAVHASLDIFEEAGGIEVLRAKSTLLTNYLEYLLEKHIVPLNVLKIITPKDPNRRGCQLSLLFSIDIENIHKQISEKGVICDLRKPNVMRIAPTPLYNSFLDVWTFVDLLKSACENNKD
eukprot:TRINITY_DN1052_c1_g1_i1.p1 TRINITY_DN1052_c1_g1~~TRINITY_DN1052_c1_g1_i1.p1  ORF type:complete len:472 (+),score=161.32 TRINITY_DN1052_c1_g1_i1:32-1447(+)